MSDVNSNGNVPLVHVFEHPTTFALEATAVAARRQAEFCAACQSEAGQKNDSVATAPSKTDAQQNGQDQGETAADTPSSPDTRSLDIEA